jgi:hypothetical protein
MEKEEYLKITICISPETAAAIVRNDGGVREAVLHGIVNAAARAISERAARIAQIAFEKAEAEAEVIGKMGLKPGGIVN